MTIYRFNWWQGLDQTWKKLRVVLADILSKIPPFWRNFELEIPHFDLRWRKERWRWKIEDWSRRIEVGWWRWIFLVILCRKSHFFEDILKLWIFRLRTFYNFFKVWTRLSAIDKILQNFKNLINRKQFKDFTARFWITSIL